nr:class I SAM-dependent methyltransferase [Kribbella sandramycini]
MVRSLRAAGLFQGEKVAQSTDQIRAALGAPPAHHRVLDRWLRALVGNGYLTTDGSGFRAGRAIGDLDDAWQRARAAWASGLGSPTFVDYLRSNADHLDALVRGEQEATYLLFPQGRTDLADAVYRETITARYLNAAIAALVQELPRPLRVLEVGAGTGATTDAVLAAIGVAPTEYVFTDVSAYFLSIARERLPEWLKYERYDIDAAPPFEPRRFDLIICAGVLNNARNADRTVAGLVELLTPGGHLVITEPTREHYEILISQAFMMTAAEDARDADDGAMFLTRAQWLDILGETETVAVLPAEEHPLAPLGQRLFLVRRHLSAPPR